MRLLEQANGARKGILNDLDGVTGQEGAESRPDDNQNFRRVPKRQQVSALKREAEADTDKHDN